MRFSRPSIPIILLWLSLATAGAFSQAERKAGGQSLVPRETARADLLMQSAMETFNKIETACASADPNLFSPLFAPKVYLNLFTGENGFFSANQAYFILRRFFGAHRIINCSIQTRSVNTSSPYATGQIQYFSRGMKFTAQLYAALTRTEEGWYLNHLTLSQRP